MSIPPPASQSSDFFELIKAIAIPVFGGLGAATGVFLKFLTDREKRKIAEAEKRLQNVDTIEALARHQREALSDIYGICLTIENLGNTFETSQITAKQFAFLIEVINSVRDKAEDVLHDGVYETRFKKQNRSNR